MEQQKKYDFFLCYSRQDRDLVQPWADTLAHYGFSCFMDMTRLQSGDEFVTTIIDSIKQSRALLFFASPNANNSSWARRELEYADKKGIKIIPKITEKENPISMAITDLTIILSS